ncbi:MAG: hypothetical protein JRI97_06280 [Deltaproteobacteria bacterium]|nr:hypothetical protein [Deltaproteobacteria bacterium]
MTGQAACHRGRSKKAPAALALVLLAMGFAAWALFPVKKSICPAVVLYPPEGFTLVEAPPNRISVQVAGPNIQVKRLAAGNPVFSPDLSGAKKGVVTVPTGLDPHLLPRGVRVVSASPSTITFTLDREILKEMPTRVLTTGEPAYGYTVAAVAPDPDLVFVMGPEGLLSGLDFAPTRPVDLTGKSADFKADVPLDLPESAVTVSMKGPVVANVSISRIMGEKRITGVPVEVISGGDKRARVQPTTIDLLVQGPVDVLETLAPGKNMRVWMDARDLSPGVYAKRAVIRLPLEAALDAASPKVFTLEVWR